MVRLPDGYRLIELEEVDSTNAEALRAARRGEAGGLWVRARRQVAARGSRGRGWVSLEGNLFSTLLLMDCAPLRVLPELSFVASLAVHEALCRSGDAAFSRRIALKWPNDVLIGGRKTSGILLENLETPAGHAVAIGIGINVASYPPGALFDPTCLAAEGVETTPEQMLERLAVAMDWLLTEWDGGAGFSRIRDAWLAHATGIGQRIVVRLPGQELSGTFESLDADGMLRLRTEDGATKKLSTADIFFANQV